MSEAHQFTTFVYLGSYRAQATNLTRSAPDNGFYSIIMPGNRHAKLFLLFKNSTTSSEKARLVVSLAYLT